MSSLLSPQAPHLCNSTWHLADTNIKPTYCTENLTRVCVLATGVLADAHKSRPTKCPWGIGEFTLPPLVLILTCER